MAGVTISSAVRTNLLSLQNISSQQSTVQNRLATGKKVNSALDNATSFFTASSFTNRAASLSSLQDSISTGVQTLQAANNGITSITSLVNQLRSTAQQALQSTSAYTSQAKVTSTTAVAGATAADLRGTTGATATSTAALSSLSSRVQASVTSTNAASAATSANYTTDDTKTITVNDGTTTFTATIDAANATDGSNGKFKDAASLVGALNKDATAKFKASIDSNGKLNIVGTGNGNTVTVGGTATTVIAAIGVSTTAATGTAGSVLTLGDGTVTGKNFIYDTNASASDAFGFKDAADLNTKIGAQGLKASATDASGKLKLSGTDLGTSLSVGGTAQSTLGFATSIATANPLSGKNLTFTVGSNTKTVTFGDPATTSGAIKSLDDLNSSLADVGLSASLDSSGNLAFQTTSTTASKTFSISGNASGSGTAFTTTASTAPVRGGSGADNRDSLVTQFNGLLNQIDTIAKDANFNGLNLLNGDTLSLIFNEKNTSKLDVNGTSANSTGLGLSSVSASNFNDGGGINSILTLVDNAKSSLATQASKFGSNLAVVQTRQDFTKQTINTLQTGSDNLVNADLNEEATNLLSLNTSQSLAQQALSLANQSQQSVLQLLR